MYHDLQHSLRKYEIWIGKQQLSKTTKRLYVSRVRTFVEFVINSSDAIDRTAEDLPALYAARMKEKLSGNSLNAALTAVSHFFKFLDLHIEVDRERFEDAPLRVLSDEQISQVLKMVDSKRAKVRALVHIFLYTGIRLSECQLLDVDDIRLLKPGNSILLVPGKESRSIPMNSVVQQSLETWLEERDLNLSLSSAALFTNARGERLSVRGIDYLIRSLGWETRMCLSAELLRTTCLSKLAETTDDPRVVAKIAGFRTLESCQRYWPADRFGNVQSVMQGMSKKTEKKKENYE